MAHCHLSLETRVFQRMHQFHFKPIKPINTPQIPVILLSSPSPPFSHYLQLLFFSPFHSIPHPCYAPGNPSLQLFLQAFFATALQVGLDNGRHRIRSEDEKFHSSPSQLHFHYSTGCLLPTADCQVVSAQRTQLSPGSTVLVPIRKEWQQLPVPPMCSVSFLFPLSIL